MYVSGEHIDYCGYAVLPMAVEQDVIIAAAVNADSILRLNNSNSEYKWDSVLLLSLFLSLALSVAVISEHLT